MTLEFAISSANCYWSSIDSPVGCPGHKNEKDEVFLFLELQDLWDEAMFRPRGTRALTHMHIHTLFHLLL